MAGLTGAYAQLKTGNGYYRQQFLSNMFAASDQGQSSFNHRDFRFGTITNADPMIEQSWIFIYRAIKEANSVIARVPGVPEMDEELRLRILGEARFLRALHYFNLVRCYGEVPLRTGIASALLDKKGPKLNVEKQSKSEVELSKKKSKIK